MTITLKEAAKRMQEGLDILNKFTQQQIDDLEFGHDTLEPNQWYVGKTKVKATKQYWYTIFKGITDNVNGIIPIVFHRVHYVEDIPKWSYGAQGWGEAELGDFPHTFSDLISLYSKRCVWAKLTDWEYTFLNWPNENPLEEK